MALLVRNFRGAIQIYYYYYYYK